MSLIAIGSEITGPVVYVDSKNTLDIMANAGKCSDAAIYAFPTDKGGTKPSYVYAIYDKTRKAIVCLPNDGHVTGYGSNPNREGLWEKKYSSGYFYTNKSWRPSVRTATVTYVAGSLVKNLKVTAYCICEAYYMLIVTCNYNTTWEDGTILSDLTIDGEAFWGKAHTRFSHNIDYSVDVELDSKKLTWNHNAGDPMPSNGQPLVGTLIVRK